jgi:hypothetical protein
VLDGIAEPMGQQRLKGCPFIGNLRRMRCSMLAARPCPRSLRSMLTTYQLFSAVPRATAQWDAAT